MSIPHAALSMSERGHVGWARPQKIAILEQSEETHADCARPYVNMALANASDGAIVYN